MRTTGYFVALLDGDADISADGSDGGASVTGSAHAYSGRSIAQSFPVNVDAGAPIRSAEQAVDVPRMDFNPQNLLAAGSGDVATAGAGAFGVQPVEFAAADTGRAAASSGSQLITAPLVAVNAPAYDIVINYTGDSAYQSYFANAAKFWELFITADVPDQSGIPGVPGGLVDDLYIDASAAAIDGAGGILGQAGPQYYRSGSFLPTTGVMQFDSADLANMVTNGTLTNVIIHEMGHVIGIGTMWGPGFENLVQEISVPVSSQFPTGTDYRYIGASALAEYRTLSANASAAYIQVESTLGGSGTIGGHWDETIFTNEIMTGFLSGGSQPISRMTLAELRDQGYTVDLGFADPYWLSSTPLALRDDRSGNYNTTTTIAIGSTSTGTIELNEDNDWFQVNLVAGTIYTFEMKGSPTSSGTLTDAFLRLRAADGESLAFNDNNGTNANALIQFTATSTGLYYLDASASGSQTGTYTVTTLNSGSSGPTLSIAATSADKVEGNTGTTAFTFTVTRVGGSTGTASANWAVGNGTAPSTDAADFSGATSGTVNFADGETSKIITVNVLGDTTSESSENFVVTLSGATGATLGTATATGVVQNDDAAPLPDLTITAASLDDTTVDSNQFVTISFTVQNVGAAATPGSYDVGYYLSTDATVTATDTFLSYATLSSLAAGASHSTSAGFNIPTGLTAGGTYYIGVVADDLAVLAEGSETNNVSSPIAVTINGGASLSIAATAADKLEGNSGVDPFTFTVTRSGSTAGAVSANWTVTPGVSNGTNAADFVALSGVVSFAAGETVKTIDLWVVDDQLLEADENFVITLSGVSGATLGTASASGVIRNDDLFTNGDDVVALTIADQSWSALGGNDSVTGTSGDDAIYGNAGNDTLNGGAGVDILDGGTGDDIIFYDASDGLVLVLGGADTDTLVFTSGAAPTTFDLTAHQFEKAEGRFSDPGGNAWASYVNNYDSAWRLTHQTGLMDSGQTYFEDYDELGTETWVRITYWNDSLARPDVETGQLDDGRVYDSDIDNGNLYSWTRIDYWRDALGRSDVETGYLDDGRTYNSDLDNGDAFVWFRIDNWADSLARLDYQNGVYDADDATRPGWTWQVDYDQADQFAWTRVERFWNAAGVLQSETFF